jgi:L-amino acid N-acyltransferase YncA
MCLGVHSRVPATSTRSWCHHLTSVIILIDSYAEDQTMIRPVKITDAPAFCAIYNHYVEHTIITFAEKPVSINDMENVIREVTAAYPWLVYEQTGTVIGYAYAARWKSRASYRHCAETTIYLAQESRGRGIGGQLYGALIEKCRPLPIHTLIGCIALPNPASVALHEQLKFEKVAHFREVGRKFNQWIDVGYWELILEMA